MKGIAFPLDFNGDTELIQNTKYYDNMVISILCNQNNQLYSDLNFGTNPNSIVFEHDLSIMQDFLYQYYAVILLQKSNNIILPVSISFKKVESEVDVGAMILKVHIKYQVRLNGSIFGSEVDFTFEKFWSGNE